ncbi:hypothetical protein [Arachnia propionica]|uniref:DUF4913 domain-containing protein n=1 Tax=Arachnia propionica TaxID=1750 RepID=A0A3P1WXP8_9ACTN|nr:hypothetical protein [Arachnia propionica]RRD50527.1 hypothetical protein EII35_03760 [Arachnia propionica]
MSEHVDEQAVRDDAVSRLSQEVAQQSALLSQVIERLRQTEARTTTVATRGGKQEAVVLWPWSLDPDRTVEEWERLIVWVDGMCVTHAVTAIPPCWLAHPDLVNQLEALRCAWEIAAANHPGPELIAWYTYSWRPFLGYVQGVDRCRNGHQPDPPATVTDARFHPLAAEQG